MESKSRSAGCVARCVAVARCCVVLALCLLGSVACATVDTLGAPESVYERAGTRVERYFRYRYDSYTGRAYPEITVRIYGSGQLLFEGRPADIGDDLLGSVARSLAAERSYAAVDLYGVTLGENIQEYPGFAEYGLDQQRRLRIFRRDAKEPADWDAFLACVDATGCIVEMQLLRILNSAGAMDDFFGEARRALAQRFAYTNTMNSEEYRRAAESELRRNSGGLADIRILTKPDVLALYGVTTTEQFCRYFYSHFRREMGREMEPEVEASFAYIVCGNLSVIALTESERHNGVVLRATAVGAEAGQQRVNDAILDGL